MEELLNTDLGATQAVSCSGRLSIRRCRRGVLCIAPIPCSLGPRHRRHPAPPTRVAVVAQDNQSCKFAQKLSYLPAVLLRVMLTPSSVAPKVGTVGPDSCFRRRRMPELGLELKSRFAWRVYVLDCGDGLMYVGIALSKNIGERIRTHFQGKGAHFTREHKPNRFPIFGQRRIQQWKAWCF